MVPTIITQDNVPFRFSLLIGPWKRVKSIKYIVVRTFIGYKLWTSGNPRTPECWNQAGSRSGAQRVDEGPYSGLQARWQVEWQTRMASRMVSRMASRTVRRVTKQDGLAEWQAGLMQSGHVGWQAGHGRAGMVSSD